MRYAKKTALHLAFTTLSNPLSRPAILSSATARRNIGSVVVVDSRLKDNRRRKQFLLHLLLPLSPVSRLSFSSSHVEHSPPTPAPFSSRGDPRTIPTGAPVRSPTKLPMEMSTSTGMSSGTAPVVTKVSAYDVNTAPTTTNAPPPQAAAKEDDVDKNGKKKPKKIFSFYRRPLPTDTCIALSSKVGKKIFQSALMDQGIKSFFQLLENHSTQSEPAYCGITTLTIALNSMNIDPNINWKGPWRWYEESMLNCCISLDEVKETGITLRIFNCLAICQGISSQVYHVDKTDAVSINTFRDTIKEACVSDDDVDDDDDAIIGDGEVNEDHKQESLQKVLVVSYDRKVLRQTGSGHFSPIAAYDPSSDSVLIMDTARFKYGAHWVKVPLLYDAMMSIDPDTNRSRGFVLLSSKSSPDDGKKRVNTTAIGAIEQQKQALPVSILLRSQMKGKYVRRRYYEFLEKWKSQHGPNGVLGSSDNGLALWESTYEYWTKNYTDTKYIWSMVDPAYRPIPTEVEQVSRLRSLIRDVMPDPPQVVATGTSRCCGGKHLNVTSDEAIYVVYLASLMSSTGDEDGTKLYRKILDSLSASSKSGSHSQETIHQLVAEAKLVQYGIETAKDMISEDDEEEVSREGPCIVTKSTALQNGDEGGCGDNMIFYEKPKPRSH